MPTLPALALASALAVAAPPPSGGPAPDARPAILLADFDSRPEVAVSWTTRAGETVRLEGERPYAGDQARTHLGRNVECFVAAGGTRLSKGAGHPDGAIVRVGFYKKDADRLFFDAIAPDGRVRVELRGVRFNQPVGARPDSAVQHLKFAPEQLEVCSLPTDARDQYNMAAPDDTLNERITPGEDTRLGALDGASPDHGSVSITTNDDASLTLVCEFPYTLLRHLQDPWRSDVPGTFAEPIHFHIEFEALPIETLRRIESGQEPWPPPSRQLDESAPREMADPAETNGDD